MHLKDRYCNRLCIRSILFCRLSESFFFLLFAQILLASPKTVESHELFAVQDTKHRTVKRISQNIFRMAD